MFRSSLFGLSLFIATLFSAPSYATPIYSYQTRFHPVIAQNGIVASQESVASKIGLSVLQKGGNAVDAAVTMGFALAVTLPQAGNLGGGGFMLIHIASENRTIALDFRETAPFFAHKQMFLNDTKEKNVDTQKSRFSHQSSGTPGSVAGLLMALEKYGTITIDEAIEPALNLAKNGIIVTPPLHDALRNAEKRLHKSKAARAVYYPTGDIPKIGSKLIQKDLAWSLKEIKTHGAHAFYYGNIAKKIVSNMKKNNGLISMADLSNYSPVLRTPTKGTYRGFDIYAMPPPSSGGPLLIHMLNILEHYPIARLGHNSAKTMHVMTESMKLAYSDRAQYLGDPDYSKMPVKGFASKAYADTRRRLIELNKATTSKKIKHGIPFGYESNETTHYSVVDKWGNAVSTTTTLNFSFGSGIMVPRTGILLNNEMDDFSAKPGEANAYGLLGGAVNAIAPNKRMLSSMTPTIVLKKGKVYMVTGTPGGSRIITTVLQLIMNIIDHKMTIAEATAAPRFHHQWLPDKIRIESGFSQDTLNILKAMGHKVIQQNAMGSTQSIMNANGKLFGASDPRKPGALTIGY